MIEPHPCAYCNVVPDTYDSIYQDYMISSECRNKKCPGRNYPLLEVAPYPATDDYHTDEEAIIAWNKRVCEIHQWLHPEISYEI